MPAPQTLHALHAPPLRYLFAVQVAHSVLLGPVHVPQLASHAAQAVFALALHAVTVYSLTPQALQARHWPPLRYLPPAQLVHWLAPAPEQVAQAALQAPHTVLAVVVQAVDTYSFAPQVVQVRHCPPLL